MQKVKCRTAFNARDEERQGIIFSDESLAQQHFKDESDVNFIVNRYLQTGEFSNVNEAPPAYGDVSDLSVDLIGAFDAVRRAESSFMNLPSEVRKELNNDPRHLLAWIHDNYDQAAEFGLVRKKETEVSVEQKPNTSNEDSSKIE